ncbi:hypothetical protein [Hydrotalea flava]|nr:hypothetical protein [Hydrotalea flava]
MALTLKDNTTDNKRTEKMKDNLPNRTQAHPPPDQWTLENLSATFDNNRV